MSARLPLLYRPQRTALQRWFAQASFWAPLNDLGNGEVNLGLLRGTGSATFTRAAPASCRLSNGLLKKVASGVARAHYSPGGIYLGYRPEGQRTNLMTRSEEVGASGWSPQNVSITADQGTAPDGTVTMDQVANVDAGAVTFHYALQNQSLVQDTKYALSMFVKYVAGSGIVWLLGNAADDIFCYVNVQTGVVTQSSGFVSASVEDWGNGVYRLVAVFTNTALTGSQEIGLGVCEVTGTPNFNSTGKANQERVLAWGAQLEAASSASSYIPTTTVAVTRNADQLTYPLAGNASSTVGTCYAETLALDTSGSPFPRIIGTWSGDGTALYIQGSSNKIGIFDNTAERVSTNTIVENTAFKASSAWGGSTSSIALDGILTSGLIFDGDLNLMDIAVGTSSHADHRLFGAVKNVRIWTRKPPDYLLQRSTVPGSG